MRFGVVVAALVLAALPLANRALAYHTNDPYFGSSCSNICDATPRSQCVANDANHFYGLVDLSTSRAAATTRAPRPWDATRSVIQLACVTVREPLRGA
ncbi:MAG: hypothetical protein HYX54_06625 [Chloroflexi bacterium]|nr:hypothetical protein [Chloroflexota bacterium]